MRILYTQVCEGLLTCPIRVPDFRITRSPISQFASVQCEWTKHPSPIFTFGPICTKCPIYVSFPIDAVSSTCAVSSMMEYFLLSLELEVNVQERWPRGNNFFGKKHWDLTTDLFRRLCKTSLVAFLFNSEKIFPRILYM